MQFEKGDGDNSRRKQAWASLFGLPRGVGFASTQPWQGHNAEGGKPTDHGDELFVKTRRRAPPLPRPPPG